MNKVIPDIDEIMNHPVYVENFLNQFKDTLEPKLRFSTCEPIRIEVKSYQLTQTGIDIEFYNQDDANLFWNNQDKQIELIFNSLK